MSSVDFSAENSFCQVVNDGSLELSGFVRKIAGFEWILPSNDSTRVTLRFRKITMRRVVPDMPFLLN